MNDEELLRGVDLNLLRALLAALEAPTITDAARRIGLTQSAMSRALDRLRHVLGDALFVRSGRRVVPTPRAQALQAPLRAAFSALGAQLLAPTPFDPRTTRRRFTIEARDYADIALVPELVARLARRAPGASLRVVRPEHGIPPEQIDLRLHPVGAVLGPNEELLFEETFVVAGRARHPKLAKRLDARSFAALRHVLVAPEGGTSAVVDAQLAHVGLERAIAAFLPGYTGLAVMLEESDLVAVLPARIAGALGRHHRLCIRPLPVAIPSVRAGQSWHARFARDEAVHFLRTLVRDVLAS